MGPASGSTKHMPNRLAVTRSGAPVEASKQKQYRLAVARLGVAVEAMKQQKWVGMATVSGECSAALGLPIGFGVGKHACVRVGSAEDNAA